MDYNNLLVESSDGLAIVTFNRPKVLNALNRDTLVEFIDIANSLAANRDSLQSLILSFMCRSLCSYIFKLNARS